MELATKTLIPVGGLLQDLVDTDSESLILVAFLDELFINPKLCCCDGLSLWDTGKVKSKLSSVLLVQKVLILINYKEDTERREEVIGFDLVDFFMCFIKIHQIIYGLKGPELTKVRRQA